MAQLLVIVELLNKRNAVPATFADRSGIIGVVKKGFQFEGTACTDTQNAAPGKWYRDRDGYFYWGGGLTEVTERLRIPYDEQKMGWHFRGPDGIDVLNLWNNHGLYGQNVRVAVIDSGISTSITDIMNAVKDRNLDMKSFVAGEGIEDDTGHGTQCASIIASRGMQLYGAAPQCELIVAKVRSLQKAQNSQVVLAALQWACDERNADIVSMSFNGKKEDKPIADFIADHFTNMNKLFIASVGNIGALGKDLPAYPANYEGCISIGAYGHGRMH